MRQIFKTQWMIPYRIRINFMVSDFRSFVVIVYIPVVAVLLTP